MVNGYKKTEIGVVPGDWDVLPFGEVFRTLSNNTLSRDQLNYDSGSIKDIHYGDVLILYPEVLDCSRDDIPYVNNDAPLSCQPLQQGDVIISDTAEDETVGKAVEIANQGNTNIVAGLHTIPCRVKNGNFVSGWLGYFINSHYYHDQLLPYIHGTKVSSIARESLADTYIVMPPYGEQEKIVKTLTDIGRLISESEQLIEKYQAMKQGCLQHMFPRKGQTKPDMRLPGFTGAWEQRKLSEEMENFIVPMRDKPRVFGGDIPWTRIEDIEGRYLNGTKSHQYVSKETIQSMNLQVISKGSLIVSMSATFGAVAEVTTDLITNQTFIGMVPKSKNELDFWYTYFHSDAARRYMQLESAGSTIFYITREKFEEMPVTLPANHTERFALGDFFLKLDNLITLHQRKCEKYKMIKQGMMEDLLTGKVRLK